MSHLSRVASDLLRGAADLLFAPVCLGCGGHISTAGHERRVCPLCWSRSPQLPRPRCDRCWSPVVPGALASSLSCTTCAELPPSLRALRSAYLFDGPPRRLVHALKYEGWHSLAGPMGERMAKLEWPRETAEEVRLVVPVPLSGVRRRQRGYNQAERLAQVVSLCRGWRCLPELLERSRATETQTTLHPAERRANVAGAFRVGSGQAELVQGEHLLLVDDVWTTGATAQECCEALVRAGARAVSVLTFARALPEAYR